MAEAHKYSSLAATPSQDLNGDGSDSTPRRIVALRQMPQKAYLRGPLTELLAILVVKLSHATIRPRSSIQPRGGEQNAS